MALVLEEPKLLKETATTNLSEIGDALAKAGWFTRPGAYVLVDGQFGSTGKGLLAGVLGEVGLDCITHVTTNAGPNSGHTAYIATQTGENRVMTQQVPIASVVKAMRGRKDAFCYLNAGAVIDLNILAKETDDHDILNLVIHPNAAVIRQEDRDRECNGDSGPAKIASTAKGVGAALAAKVMRECNTARFYADSLPGSVSHIDWDWHDDVVFVETAQGFSLGINSPQFYPHTTSRECTAMQALADARIPAQILRKVACCFRTFPIRVGNTANGRSGDCYPDQQEIQWSDIGVEPELTSVTKRVRRIFTWSRMQFKECIAANRPDLLFFNFLQYLQPSRQHVFLRNAIRDYKDVLGKVPETVLLGYGPRPDDVEVR